MEGFNVDTGEGPLGFEGVKEDWREGEFDGLKAEEESEGLDTNEAYWDAGGIGLELEEVYWEAGADGLEFEEVYPDEGAEGFKFEEVYWEAGEDGL